MVIGILLALQINNWNENRKLKQEQVKVLKIVQESLVQDTFYLDLLIKRLDLNNASIIFLASFPKYHDSLSVHFERTTLGIVFQLRTAPFEQIKATGFKMILDGELKQKLIQVYDFSIPRTKELIDIELTSFDSEILVPFYYKQFSSVEKDSLLSDVIVVPKNYKELIKNPDYKTILLDKKIINDLTIKRLKNIKIEIKKLLMDVEQVLSE